MDKKILPSADRSYLLSKGYQFREISDGATSGLIIDNFPVLPAGKFNVLSSTLMIILPSGYPDIPPDMFYFSPAVLMAGSNAFPQAAASKPVFFGITWQCWSRHAPAGEWRMGIDNIQSYIQRVVTALKITQ